MLRGGGLDESPHAYRRLPDVLIEQGETINVLHTLRPVIVAMAGADIRDPFKEYWINVRLFTRSNVTVKRRLHRNNRLLRGHALPLKKSLSFKSLFRYGPGNRCPDEDGNEAFLGTEIFNENESARLKFLSLE